MTDDHAERLTKVARLLDFTGTPDGLRRLIEAAGFVPAEEATRTVSREAYERAADWVRNNRLDELSGAGVVDELLSRLDLTVAPPKTPEERIEAFAAAMRALSGPIDETWARCVFQLIHTHLGVEL